MSDKRSLGDFEEVLAALLGKDAPGLSASPIARLKEVWIDEHARWQKRDLSARRYVYVWADGIHLQARLEDEKQCILVIIGRSERLSLTINVRSRPRAKRSCSASPTAPARARKIGAICCLI